MARSRALQYLPTLVVGLAILLVIFLTDAQHDRVLQQAKREEVSKTVDSLRSGIEQRIDDDILSSYHLANALEAASRVRTPTQADFEQLVQEAFEGRSELLLTEFAPGSRTARVHPLEGNEARLGRDISGTPGELPGEIRVGASFAVLVFGPLVGTDGRNVVVLRLPVLTTNDKSEIVEGVLSVQLDIAEVLEQVGASDVERKHDLAILYSDDIGGVEKRVYGADDISREAAVSEEVSISDRNWTILAQPRGGWAPESGEKLRYRLYLALLGAVVLAPTLLANRYAVARRETIGELEAIREKLTGVIANLPGAVLSHTMPPGRVSPGPEDRVEFFNKSACEEIWGVPASAAEAHVAVLWAMGTDAERQRELERKAAEAAERLTPFSDTIPIRTADGAEKWLQVRSHPTRLSDGSTRLYALVADVTADIERAAELERQRELTFIAQKNDSLGKLTGGVAHDFNNLLAVVMGNQELLREALLAMNPLPDPQLLDFVESSVRATERGADLTRKMLAFAGRARLEPARIDINDIVRETAAWAGRTLPDTIHVETILQESLPLVQVDRGSAESALLNLIINARDAMPDGGRLYIETFSLELEAGHPYCRERGLAPGTCVELVVRDTGKGIAPDALPRIFEPFFTTKPPASGAGLGLSMVKGFMEQSGGAVIASSELGEGTTVRLLFCTNDASEDGGRSEAARAVHTGPGEARILLAEDEEDVRQTLASALTRVGYNVTEASSGDAAFEVFKNSPEIDLLLTDIVMPGKLQGTDLARAVRCMSPGLPVVFLSGHASGPSDPDEPGDLRTLHLNKPVSRDELVSAVETVLGRAAPL
ncbi:ATP-binding protein [Tropicimonas sp. IMCC6043]|uniref:ATP-binding protein n=1 Tax=Tropicimonas sp. IMCC6043 TaxID=2510645 RepID=UPI0013E9ECF8|nr:ATP-binding protein [Tropicimonas sp. IMCC6043]